MPFEQSVHCLEQDHYVTDCQSSCLLFVCLFFVLLCSWLYLRQSHEDPIATWMLLFARSTLSSLFTLPSSAVIIVYLTPVCCHHCLPSSAVIIAYINIVCCHHCLQSSAVIIAYPRLLSSLLTIVCCHHCLPYHRLLSSLLTIVCCHHCLPYPRLLSSLLTIVCCHHC